MMSQAQFLFLGTGGSMGVPVIGCNCEVCHSHSPYNKRLRPSALISWKEQSILIDCGPDFRQQALHYNIKKVNSLMLTHAHNDHTAGIDDLRIFYLRSHQSLPCLLSEETAADLRIRYYYIFKSSQDYDKQLAKLQLVLITNPRGIINFQGLKIRYVTFEQGKMKVNGFRLGNLAYVSDIRLYPETIFEDLAGVKILILSALRFTPSPLHFSVDEAIEFANRVGAEQTWLTHISHDLDHEKTNAYLPPHIRMAYDGLKIDFQLETSNMPDGV